MDLKKLLLFICALFIGVALIHRSTREKGHKKNQFSLKDDSHILNLAAREVQKRFENGDVENLIPKNRTNCPKILVYNKDVHSDYYRCNPNYLQCYLQGGVEGNRPDFKINGEVVVPIKLKNKKYYRFIPKKGHLIRLGFKTRPKITSDYILENKCSMVALPARNYISLRGLSGKEIQWSSENRKIFIDIYQATNRDINEWIQSDRQKIDLEMEKNISRLGLTALNLNAKQMQAYCKFRGKKLLSYHLFEAATFHPLFIEDPKNPAIRSKQYPWNQKKDEIFLARANKENSSITANDCQKAYVQECLDIIPYQHHSPFTTSWTGINQVLGGPMEALYNHFLGRIVLRASSFYFKSNSRWHSLSEFVQPTDDQWLAGGISWKRGSNPFTRYSDAPEGVENGEKLKVAFRCAKEVFP